jgi:hypothetical protein
MVIEKYQPYDARSKYHRFPELDVSITVYRYLRRLPSPRTKKTLRGTVSENPFPDRVYEQQSSK